MSHLPHGFDLESLLAESASFRRLAAALARDVHERDDLVQDTWLAALEEPPRWKGNESDTRGWFARVLRRRWSRARRAEELRRAHEPRAARAEAQEFETQTDERLALQQRVLQALSELDEPGRSALRLSHLEGRSAREIAAIQGASEEAVRQRISRSLAKLRQKLSREDLQGLGLMALPLGVKSGVVAGAKGVLLMSMQAKLLTACACGLFLLLAWMIGTQLFSSTTGHVSVVAPPPESTESRDIVPALPSPSSRSGLVASETPRHVIDREHDLHGVVVDGDSNPIPGATVKAWHAPRSGMQFGPESERENPPMLLGETRTDERGEFALRLERGRAYELETSAPGFATQRLVDRCAGERVRVTLQHPAVLSGVVLHHPDGRPIAQASVEGQRRDDPRLGRFEARTDENGHYRSGELDPGEWTIWVYPGSGMGLELASGMAFPGEENTLSVSVIEAGVLRGRVVDAESGRPIEDATITGPFGPHGDVHTDVRGGFVVEGIKTPEQGGDGAVRFRVSAPGHANLPVQLVPSSASESSAPAEIRLTSERRIAGKVVDGRGEPVVNAQVACSLNRYSTAFATTHTGETGQFELAHIGDYQALNVVFYATGFVSHGLTLEREQLRAPVIDVGTIALQPGTRLEGLIVDEADHPVADRVVFLQECEYHTFQVQRHSRADDLGRFAFADMGPGRYQLMVGWSGDTSVTNQVSVIEKDKPPELIRLVLARKGSISGRVQDAKGAPVKHAQVILRPEGDLMDVQRTLPGEYVRNLSTEGDGTFRFLGLEAPSYRLVILPRDSDAPTDGSAPAAPRVQSDVKPGAELDIRLNEAAWQEGIVVAASGSLTENMAAQNKTVELHIIDEESGVELRRIPLDGRGHFRILLDRTRFWTLVAAWYDVSRMNGKANIVFDPEHSARVEHLTPGGEPIELRLP